MNSIPIKIKIIAAVSVFLFAVSIIVSIIIGSNFNTLAGEYKTIFDEQKELEQWIYNQNNEFYEEMLLTGFVNIPGGKEAVRKAVQNFYRYRLSINGRLVNRSDYPLTQDSCIITIEEYYLSHAINYLPVNVLNYFKYLKNKGQGGEELPANDIIKGIDLNINIPQNFNTVVTRTTTANSTVINIEVTGMVPGSDIDISLSTSFMQKFGAERFIHVRTVR